MIFLKSSALNDDVFGKSQHPIKKFLLDNEAAEMNAHKIMESIFDVMPVDDFATKFSGLTSRGNFQDVGENGAYPETEEQVGYSTVIEDTTWKSEFKVSKEMIEDAKMYDIRKRAASFTRSYYRTRGQYAAAIINNGASTTMSFQSKSYNIACNDSLALFSTAHTSITGGASTQSNYYSAGFSYDNLCKVEELMNAYVDDNGMRVDVQPDTIIIPRKARIMRLIEDALNTSNGGRPDNATFSGIATNIEQIGNPIGKLTDLVGYSASTNVVGALNEIKVNYLVCRCFVIRVISIYPINNLLYRH